MRAEIDEDMDAIFGSDQLASSIFESDKSDDPLAIDDESDYDSDC